MEYTYKEITDEIFNANIIVRSDGWQIPADPNNPDYQEYLLWKAQQTNGGTE